MQCYSEIIPPTGVTESLQLSFTTASANNLIVAKTSLLQIFDLRTSDTSSEARLVLLAEYALQGTISALARVTLVKSKSGGDAVLIAFRDAKLSLVEWEPSQHSISTISIHYYENNDMLLSPWSPDLKDCLTRLTVDPSSRCAAFNFNENSLAIIPFHQAQDDLAMDDDDLDDVDEDKSPTKQTNGQSHHDDKLYFPSFVLPMTALDPGLLHPIAITFLYEYREPTLGVLFSTSAPSMNMAPIRTDILTYAVYTLDIEQKASTTLISVTKLPNDLYQVMALPAPIGGTLLVGGNELVHIDQSGRSNAVAVNEFSKQASSFAMADQSDLELRLEGCQVQSIGAISNEVLFVLNDGQFAVLTFRTDGRSVSGLHLQSIDPYSTATIFQSRCSTIVQMANRYLFLGSEEADSVLISTSNKSNQLKRIPSRAYLDDANGDFKPDDDMDDEDDEDDLYADSKTNGAMQQGTFEPSSIVLEDTLRSIAPLGHPVLGRPPKRKREEDGEDILDVQQSDRLDLVASCNRGTRASLAFLSRSLQPNIVKRHKLAQGSLVWAMSSEPSELEVDARPFDDMLVVSQGSQSPVPQSTLLSLTSTVQERTNNDFETGDKVIATGRLNTGSHVVVYSRDVRAYNKYFGLDQIYAIVEEEAGATAEVVAASVTDTHILILKSDNTIIILKVDKSGDLDEVNLPDSISSEDISSACLFDDHYDFFNTKQFSGKKASAKPLVLAVLTGSGVFSLHPLSNLDVQIFSYAGLDFLPTQLSPELDIPKHWRTKDSLLQISLHTLGSNIYGKPYLIIRNSSSDITIYEPYRDPEVQGVYRFVKTSCHNGDPRDAYNEKGEEQSDHISRCSLIPLHDVGGASVIFAAGKYPRIITKPNAGMPRVHWLDIGPVEHISSFHDSSCNRGFVYIDSQNCLTFCEIPADIILDHADWVIRKIGIGEEVSELTYHPRTGAYVVATSTPAPFHLPRDDEWHPEWDAKNESATPNFLPTTRSHALKLISAVTHSIISQHTFAEDEQVLCVKCLNIEISEQTHERKDVIVVGTGIVRGENVVSRGCLYLFDVVDVVPHPEIPETDLKLKLMTREDVRGAVTAISSIGSQGFILAAQGQKCMVRGLREDNAILPVAFLDLRYYVSVAKELPGTGLTILADAFSGLWLTGYSEEPYKMQLLGKDLENPSIVAAEFMPQDKQLFIIAADGNGDLRILQYDPWNPKTERGSILLHRSTFNTGYLPTMMTLLPRTPTSSEALVAASASTSSPDDNTQLDPPPSPFQNTHQILITTREGALTLITPLSEQAYRRLSTLQTTLTTQLDQPCGLNPRAHRQIETDGVGGRAMIDGMVVRRWLEQSSQHKYQLADRVGGTVWDVRSDLEGVVGGGLGYL